MHHFMAAIMIKLEKREWLVIKKKILILPIVSFSKEPEVELPLIKTNPKPKKAKLNRIRIVRLVIKYSEKIGK
jgi:hypothetical protein